jgi:ferric-dicitrate binding protein FerR (iron transport regulator)
MDEDPELRRIVELMAGEREGRLEEAETVELALYREEQPALAEAARASLALRPALGLGPPADEGAWVERVRAGQALEAAERAPRTRGERAAGLALVAGGLALSMIGWAGGSVMLIVGLSLLLGSFIRVRLSSRDPYDRIKQ